VKKGEFILPFFIYTTKRRTAMSLKKFNEYFELNENINPDFNKSLPEKFEDDVFKNIQAKIDKTDIYNAYDYVHKIIRFCKIKHKELDEKSRKEG